ncbi:MAG: tRNA 2-thiouridine(34) synthase MnmA [Candidatus Alcyoniella australis]|nr:tRNA 2-thiouridine(34) synthase MnmA [Candidatus Alcyoniella australis]
MNNPGLTKALIAMSGGVDSAVAAALLASQGIEVVGLTLLLFDPGAEQCARAAAEQARLLGMAHETYDARSLFREQVRMPFAEAYIAGRTPNPCVWCNPRVKFAALIQRADELGINLIATGHYARIDSAGRLLRAVDPDKDQSYFLYAVDPDWLPRLRLPLGAMSKVEVRALAAQFGVDRLARPESQEICFAQGDPYHRQVLNAEEARPGLIKNSQGTVLGEHRGVHLFTVGQRRGIGVAADQPLYVIQIRPQSAEVLVGPREELDCRGLRTDQPRMLREVEPGAQALVKLRSRHNGTAARIFPDERGCEVRFDEPTQGVAPGQAAVFYDPSGEIVLGGGTIVESIR